MELSSGDPAAAGRRLTSLFDWGSASDQTWEPDEFHAIFAHLLESPVQFDLAGLDSGLRGKLARLSEAEGITLKSLHELLAHQHPPLELLALTKEWAKANHESSESGLPPEVASVLYYAAIAAALARLGKRITSLSDDQLRAGFRWASAQSWLGSGLAELFSQAQAKLLPQPS